LLEAKKKNTPLDGACRFGNVRRETDKREVQFSEGLMCFGYQSHLRATSCGWTRNGRFKQCIASELPTPKKTPTRNGLAFCFGRDPYP
ncbi:hypothetical protein N8H74_29265, partial [Pseudomonas sp. B2M1-30]|uniref:hypothetical protein n=1 Tax=Pseudomonas sp. B2M1-30 TaxID=2977324 RepID=UPI0021CACECB